MLTFLPHPTPTQEQNLAAFSVDSYCKGKSLWLWFLGPIYCPVFDSVTGKNAFPHTRCLETVVRAAEAQESREAAALCLHRATAMHITQ